LKLLPRRIRRAQRSKSLYEAEADTNAYDDAAVTKLAGIETGATADQTDAEIRAAVEAATDSNVFTDADHTKLNGIEALADVTDSTNVLSSLVGQEVVATGFTGTLDGVLGGGTPAAATVTTLTATGGARIGASGTATEKLEVTNAGTVRAVFTDSVGTGIGRIVVAGTSAFMGGGTGTNLILQSNGTNKATLDVSGNWDYGGGNLTTTGTLSAGATDVTTLTASGNVGVGVTPESWSTFRALQVGGATSIWSSSSGSGSSFYSNNVYFNTGARKRINASYATEYIQDSSAGDHIWYTAGTSTADSTITFSEKFRIANNGAATFAGTLAAKKTTITDGTTLGTSAHGSADDLVVSTNSTTGISILGSNTQAQNIFFGSPSDTIGAQINWVNSANAFNVASGKVGSSLVLRGDDYVANLTLSGASGSETATFAGNVGVNGGIGENALDISLANGDGIRLGQVDAAHGGSLTRFVGLNDLGGAGSFAGGCAMAFDAVNTNDYEIYWQTQNFGVGNPKMTFTHDGNLVLDTSGATATIDGGVYIGGSAAANLLDDYEEGTWTPTISGSSTAGTYTPSTIYGNYTKVGNCVTINFAITAWSAASGGAGSLQITGLPFAKSASQGAVGTVALDDIDLNNAAVDLSLVFNTAASLTSTLLIFQTLDNAGFSNVGITGVSTSSQIYGSITYFV
jgi:hypothetical protein